MTLPINDSVNDISVTGIDSILIGGNYRKRYKINNYMIGSEYWIEGIGSTVELLSPFTYHFEWHYYTLCYKDTFTYYISLPFGYVGDSCHFYIPNGTPETELKQFNIYPNPVTDFMTIENLLQLNPYTIFIYDDQGKLILNNEFVGIKNTINTKKLKPGIYFLRILINNNQILSKFIKK
jgi:hypothetical protein